MQRFAQRRAALLFRSLVTACVVALPAFANAQAQTGRVSGVVTDSATSLPIIGVTLTLNPAGVRSGTQLEARSDEAGRYAFPAVNAGTYTL
jgi:hypothetical protein